MTLSKYIQRLADSLNPYKQFEKAKAKHNARKARPNLKFEAQKVPYPLNYHSPQHRRYGINLWAVRAKRGRKNAAGKMLPMIDGSP